MAVLEESARSGLWAEVMRRLSAERQAVAISKTDLRAAVDAVDDWVEAAAASFNNALPAAARSGLTAKQKAMLLAWVVMKRFEVS